MQPSQPDDTGSPSPGKPRQKPVPPAVVYALDCLERGTPMQVRRHMVALGYTAEEALAAVRQALAYQEQERPSAWSPQDAVARRFMSLGFFLFVCGILTGCSRLVLLPQLTPNGAVVLNVFTWGCILFGIVVFWMGLAQKGIRRP